MSLRTFRGRAALPACLAFVASLAGAAALAQGTPTPPEAPKAGSPPNTSITAVDRSTVIEEVLDKLNDRYVHPKVAALMTKAVRAHQEVGQYDSITDGRAFAAALTADLQAISHDKHLVVTYSAMALPRTPAACPTDLGASERARCERFMRDSNFGFRKAEMLDGNVGYLRIVGFAPPDVGRAAAEAAMSFVGDADALIIDLRDNEGGSPKMLALLCSYLFEDDSTRVHLDNIYSRLDGQIHEFWTTPMTTGNDFEKKDVYVLTSSRTFSTAEELAYDLQVLKRATIVGAVTAGGAHCGNYERVSDHFVMFVPSGRCINPITQTNWEGVGVKPDKIAPAAEALDAAYLMALHRLQARATDPAAKQQYEATIDAVQKDLDARVKRLASR